MSEIRGNKPDMIIVDDIVDNDGNTTQKVTVIDLKTVATTMLGLSLLSYQELDDPYLLAGPSFFNTGRTPKELMRDTYPSPRSWDRVTQITTKPRVTKRQKVLKARALNKANRKRARHA